jgi:hypothetical protein
VLTAASSQRCAAAVIGLLEATWPEALPAPCPNTGRMWILRLGLYALVCPKEQTDDWVWIMDHTMQLGQWKCLVIVGIRLEHWNADRGALQHQDVQLLNLTPMEHATAEKVHEQLLATVKVTGVPQAVVSDEGADLRRGMELLQATHEQVVHVHDVKHKVALLMKSEMQADSRWAEFVSKCNQTKLAINQTSLAFLNPPALKSKARYMNLDILVDWGQKALRYLDNPRQFEGQPLDQQKLAAKLGWLREYRSAIAQWAELLQLADVAEDYVRKQGYHRQAKAQLRSLLRPLATSEAGVRMKEALLAFVAEQSRKARPRQRLIGSSEVLESLIGKYKRMQSTHSKGGMTAMLLSFGAIVLEKTTETINKALDAIKTTDVYEWVKSKLGTTVQAQRKLAFEGTKPAHTT